MKKLFFIVLWSMALSVSAFGAEESTIEAKIKNLKDREIVVEVYDATGSKKLLDTIISCKNGKFSFSNRFSDPTYVTFVPKSGLLDTKQIRGIVERGTMTIDLYMIEGEDYSVEGSVDGTILLFDTKGSEINSVLSGLRTKYIDILKYTDMESEYFRDNKSKAERDSVYMIGQNINEKMKAEKLEYVKSHLNGQLSGLFLSEQDYANFDNYYPQLDEGVRTGLFKSQLEKKKYYSDLLANSKKMQVGSQSIDFTLDGLDGKTVTLSSIKGKSVLLYFWGSW